MESEHKYKMNPSKGNERLILSNPQWKGSIMQIYNGNLKILIPRPNFN